MDRSMRVDLPEADGQPHLDAPEAPRSERAGPASQRRASDLTHPAGGPDGGTGALPPFEAGFLVGVLVGEGHFGGDGRQPQVTLRMHTDHAALFAWLMQRFPESRLYGPYHHAGRSYYQWMARSAFLRTHIVPLLDRYLTPEHSGRVWARYQQMKQRYGIADSDPDATTSPAPPSGALERVAAA